ncbi:TaqI-like C-terminal specificity domain-containing protein, partial [Bacteroides ovatus]
YFQEICSNKIYLGAFEWRLEFPEVLDDEGNFIGFDCIIGNPPYIQLQSIEHDADILERMEYETYARTGDIYCLFYEQGMNVLKENGCLCYITSNKWMRAGYGENLRNYFATKTNPTLLVDFAGVKIFDAATVEANILLTNKEANKYSTLACIFSDTNGLSKLSDFIQQWHIECAFRSSDSWVILSPIEQSIKRKIEAVGTPLKNWNININYGIKTGYNDAFIINTEKREEILRNCRTEDERQRTAELIRPILRGRDIKRYGYNWAGLWIIATFPSRHYNIEDFPAVKSYFLSVGIERLEQTGEVHTVNGEKIKARKKTCNKWFETQDSISYWEDFYKPKIVWKIIGNQMAFAYDKNQFIMNNACYIMTGEHLDYLLSILNSQAILWYSYVTNMNKTGVGDVQVGGQNIITFPIPAYSDNKNILAKMADCVTNQKISLKSVDYQIENIISEIFGFTTDERNFLNTFANSLRKKG